MSINNSYAFVAPIPVVEKILDYLAYARLFQKFLRDANDLRWWPTLGRLFDIDDNKMTLSSHTLFTPTHARLQ